jgi:hypothetical protein
MYYAKEEKAAGKRTPTPFCEFRVWVITKKRVPYINELFDEMLNRLEYIFFSVKAARDKNAVFFIEGVEDNRIIDNDEAMQYLSKTGIPKPDFSIPYRQVHFYFMRKNPKVYNEQDILDIEKSEFNLSEYNEWRKTMRENHVFDMDTKGLTIEELRSLAY